MLYFWKPGGSMMSNMTFPCVNPIQPYRPPCWPLCRPPRQPPCQPPSLPSSRPPRRPPRHQPRHTHIKRWCVLDGVKNVTEEQGDARSRMLLEFFRCYLLEKFFKCRRKQWWRSWSNLDGLMWARWLHRWVEHRFDELRFPTITTFTFNHHHHHHHHHYLDGLAWVQWLHRWLCYISRCPGQNISSSQKTK